MSIQDTAKYVMEVFGKLVKSFKLLTYFCNEVPS